MAPRLMITGQFRQWYFNQQLELCGYMYNDKRGEVAVEDGTYQELKSIDYVVSYRSFHLIRTISGQYFELPMNQQNYHKFEFNAYCLRKYSRGKDAMG